MVKLIRWETVLRTRGDKAPFQKTHWFSVFQSFVLAKGQNPKGEKSQQQVAHYTTGIQNQKNNAPHHNHQLKPMTPWDDLSWLKLNWDNLQIKKEAWLRPLVCDSSTIGNVDDRNTWKSPSQLLKLSFCLLCDLSLRCGRQHRAMKWN